jgi:hypothetical protein
MGIQLVLLSIQARHHQGYRGMLLFTEGHSPEATATSFQYRPMRGKRSTQPNPFCRHPVKDTTSHETTLLPIGQTGVSD